MKIALITDTHWGSRGDHLGLLDYFEKFYSDVFFPEIEARGIKHIYHLGDLVDRRKYVNFYTASRMRSSFFDKLAPYDTWILAGNHDTYHKNTSEINALTELVERYPKVNVITEPTEMLIDENRLALMLPWINTNNKDKSFNLIEQSKARYVFGHLELGGFEYSPGTFHEGGMSYKMFERFDSVMTGHFHHKSSKDNIHYLGAPYEMTWNDYCDLRGFHIFDTITGDLEFIQNPNSMFFKIVYDESDKLKDIDFSKYHKRFVKIILIKKDSPYLFEKFIDELEKANPFDVQIVEDHFNLGFDSDPELIEKTQDTFTILKTCINQLSSDNIDKIGLEKLLREVYNEASLIEA